MISLSKLTHAEARTYFMASHRTPQGSLSWSRVDGLIDLEKCLILVIFSWTQYCKTSQNLKLKQERQGLVETKTGNECKLVNSGGVDNVSSVPQFGLFSLFGTQLITVPFYHANYCCFSIQGQTLQIHPRANKLTDDKDFWWPPLPKHPRHSFKVKMPLFYWILHSCHYREQHSFRRDFNQSPVRMKG